MVRTAPLLWLVAIAVLAGGAVRAQEGREGGNRNTSGGLIGINEDELEKAPAPSIAVPSVAAPVPSAPVAGARPAPRPAATARTGARSSVAALPTMAPAAPPPRVEPPARDPRTERLSGNANTSGSLMGLDEADPD